jgi:hypothetical protein
MGKTGIGNEEMLLSRTEIKENGGADLILLRKERFRQGES